MDKAEKYWSVKTRGQARGLPAKVAFSGAINTERLRLRRLTQQDAFTIALLVSDREVSRQTVSVSSPYTLHDAQEFVANASDDWDSGKQYILGMERRSDGKLIGTVSIQIYRKWWREYGELGYWAGRDYWGEGYTGEAVEAFLVFCCANRGLKRIVAKCFADNEASLRILRKAGFEQISAQTHKAPRPSIRRKIVHLQHHPK